MLMNLTRGRNIQPIKELMNTIKNSGNPQMMLQQMMMKNPNIKQVMDYINANGGNPKDAYYKMANDIGANPDDIINQLMN